MAQQTSVHTGADDTTGLGLAALTWGDQCYEGPALGELVARVSGGLAGLGVSPGDRVALILRNGLEMVIADRAIRGLGAHPVPVNWHGTSEDISYVVSDSRCRVVIAHHDLWEPQDGVLTVVVGAAGGPGKDERSTTWSELARSESSAPATGPVQLGKSIIYTSGTTGRPKGVRKLPQTDEQRSRAGAMRDRLYGIHAGARVLMTAPLYHAAPLQMVQHTLERGQLVMLESGFDAEAFLRVVSRHGITHTFLVPTMFNRILALPEEVRGKYDVSSLEFVLHAGAPCPPSIKRRMIQLWGPVLYEYYGSTEMGPVSFSTSEEWLRHPGTVGAPLPGVDLAFISPVTGEPGAEQPAEIAVSMSAFGDFTYEGTPERRAELQCGDYVATGDIGFLRDGFLYISDRARDLVISGGVNLYPAEIESVIQELPGVADCAVFGIPDEDLGEVLAVVVQPAAVQPVSREELDRHVEARLGRLKRPRRVDFRERLPREENGKVKKRLLRNEFLDIKAGDND